MVVRERKKYSRFHQSVTLSDPRVGRVLEDPRVERVERVTATKRSRRPIKMPPAFHAQIRWLVVYKRFFLGRRTVEELVDCSGNKAKALLRDLEAIGLIVKTRNGGIRSVMVAGKIRPDRRASEFLYLPTIEPLIKQGEPTNVNPSIRRKSG